MSTNFQDTDAQKGYFSGLYEQTGKPSNNDGNYRNESIGFPIVQPLGKLYLILLVLTVPISSGISFLLDWLCRDYQISSAWSMACLS